MNKVYWNNLKQELRLLLIACFVFGLLVFLLNLTHGTDIRAEGGEIRSTGSSYQLEGRSQVAHALLADLDAKISIHTDPQATHIWGIVKQRPFSITSPSGQNYAPNAQRFVQIEHGVLRAANTDGDLSWSLRYPLNESTANLSVQHRDMAYMIYLHGGGTKVNERYPLLSSALETTGEFFWTLTPRVGGLLGLYCLACGLFYLLIWILRRSSRFWEEKNSAPTTSGGLLRFEILLSMLAVTSASILSFGIVVATESGVSMIYHRFSDRSVAYWVFSIVALFFFADFYEYWTHRIVHRKTIFKRIHKLHHYSRQPTPWTTFSINLYETAIAALVLPIAVCLIPLHDSAIIVFSVISILKNTCNHLGYGISFGNGFLDRWIVTPRFHELHHEEFDCNYGAYFTIWDKWMGTARYG